MHYLMDGVLLGVIHRVWYLHDDASAQFSLRKCCADSPVMPQSYNKFVKQCNLNFTQDEEEKIGHESLKQDVNDQGYIKDDDAFLDYVQDQYVHDSVKDQARYSAYDCMLWANKAAK
ncbi:hypothetical protein ANN_00585 [Periplaneta americana]|uniref:Uncharacterized protein n=1 Tax=Periplaneta americana TaxID=6978 RepID=A0ABQ8TR66_PERAM|nr:hypothetical protein ANN_00585 [Periplaneta americana]